MLYIDIYVGQTFVEVRSMLIKKGLYPYTRTISESRALCRVIAKHDDRFSALTLFISSTDPGVFEIVFGPHGWMIAGD